MVMVAVVIVVVVVMGGGGFWVGCYRLVQHLDGLVEELNFPITLSFFLRGLEQLHRGTEGKCNA
jgi:hypothetical protein